MSVFIFFVKISAIVIGLAVVDILLMALAIVCLVGIGYLFYGGVLGVILIYYKIYFWIKK